MYALNREMPAIPDLIAVETDQGWSLLKGDKKGSWAGSGIEVVLEVKEGQIKVNIMPCEHALFTVKLQWLGGFAEHTRFLGDHWERAYGDLEWRGIVPERVFPWYFLALDNGRTYGYGVKTGAGAFCSWRADTEQTTLTLDVRSGATGVKLAGRMLHAATIVTFAGREEGESPFMAARRFCAQMCEQPVLPQAPVYGGNNWYYAYGDSSSDRIIADSRFISELAHGLHNRPYMVIDEGWQRDSGTGHIGGPWLGNRKFPDMAALASRMKGEGVQPGIWFRPLLEARGVPDHWVRCDGGNGAVCLDPSVPDVLAYIGETVERFISWGYTLIKHDFSTFDLFGQWGYEMKADVNKLPYAFHDRSRTSAEIVLALYRTIAAAAGGHVVIGCNTLSHLAAGVFAIQRTGDDTSGKSWERTRYMGINTLAYRMPQHGTFYSHDADCIGVTPQVPWELNRQWLELLAASGTPLFVSASPDGVNEEQKVALRQAFATASEPIAPGEPLDWLTTTCPRSWRLQNKEGSFSWTGSWSADLEVKDNQWWL